MEKNPFFLKKKYGELHTAPDVVQAAKRKEAKTGKKVSEKPEALIQNFLDRFREIIEREKPEERERGLEAIKRLLRINFVIKPSDVPESTFLLEQRIARELGHGTVEITDDFRQKKTEQIIADQTHSLDKWVDYLASPDAKYPDWAKYWALRSVIEMGKFEKEQDETTGKESAVFKKRTKETVAAFPPLNPRALALSIGVLQSKLTEEQKPKKERGPIANQSKKLSSEEFQKLLSSENFSKIYAQFLIEMPEYSTEGLQEIRGEWKKFKRGSDPTQLVQSLEGYPLEWCTANPDTARTQLQGGDFHVYYSINDEGKPIIPRIAIRMEEDRIAEVRGIAPNQNTDPFIAPVVQKKMMEFPDGKAYEKKAADMKLLTAIEKKVQAGKALNKDELIFLYEIHGKIEGFGYEKDPRVDELRSQRDPVADMSIFFDYDRNQIATNLQEVNASTKVYVGPLSSGIFKIIGHLDQIYTSFLEGKIIRYNVEIGGQTEKQLEQALKRSGFKISDNARLMLKSKDFTTEKQKEQANLVCLKVDALFNDDLDHTTDEIYKKAKKFGLELCPAEVGPHLRLTYTDRSLGELHIAMKEISPFPYSYPAVFSVGRSGLYDSMIMPEYEGWDPGNQFVFRLRK